MRERLKRELMSEDLKGKMDRIERNRENKEIDEILADIRTIIDTALEETYQETKVIKEKEEIKKDEKNKQKEQKKKSDNTKEKKKENRAKLTCF
jgi:hypothetical protein